MVLIMVWWQILLTILIVITLFGLLLAALFVLLPINKAKPVLSPHQRDMRMLWKVVLISEAVLKAHGFQGKFQFGVIISADTMLEKTHTLLFCPLIEGQDEKGNVLTIMPWHVPVAIWKDPCRSYVEIWGKQKYVSTKVILPIDHEEIDTDRLERGYLDEPSKRAVAAKLALWLPPYATLFAVPNPPKNAGGQRRWWWL